MKTPMSSSIKLDKDEKDFNHVLKNWCDEHGLGGRPDRESIDRFIRVSF
ncbi:hypothetical protein CK203_041604 [Vitis vinifera]|uniref:Uncharacterized protein n=1 Tax=Vitis vinifera TaxID=29760 RepID=A0A438I7H2_VITVI|nr:hypothetical protein CK203_041604 [Vitis vinifera]